MVEIQKVQNIDYKINEMYESVFEELAKAIQTSSCQYTLIHLYSLVSSCESLKNGIGDALESGNVYVSKCLMRVLVEHFLRFNYICLSHIQTKSDTVAQEFSEYCAIKEKMDSIKAKNFENQMLGKPETNVNKAIRDIFPQMGDLSNKKINKISDKWAYKNIVHLVSTFDLDLVSNTSPFLASLVPIYSQLSSFIHGGINASNHACYLVTNTLDIQAIQDDYSSACRITGFTKVFSAMIAAQSNADLLSSVLKMNEFMDVYSTISTSD